MSVTMSSTKHTWMSVTMNSTKHTWMSVTINVMGTNEDFAKHQGVTTQPKWLGNDRVKQDAEMEGKLMTKNCVVGGAARKKVSSNPRPDCGYITCNWANTATT